MPADKLLPILYEVPAPKTLPEMTAPEVEAALKETDLIVLACGSMEAHGPHLPLAADTYQGTHLVRATCRALASMGIKSVPGPTMPYGIQTNSFERPRDYAGTCSLRPETFISMIQDIILSLHRHGFRRFVLCLSHVENEAAMHVAAKILADAYEVKCLVVNWLLPLGDAYPRILKGNSKQGHAGEGETARVMAVTPRLVDVAGVAAWYPPVPASAPLKFGQLQYFGGMVGFYAPMGPDLSPGYIGEPALATAEAGEACYEVMADFTARAAAQYFQLGETKP